MKVLRISDAIHESLKREAKAQGRTLQWVVEERLAGNDSLPPVNVGAPHYGMDYSKVDAGTLTYTGEEIIKPVPAAPKFPGTHLTPANGRTPGLVRKEIDSYKAELAERLEYNQDAESRAKIEQEGTDTLDSLWAEFHQLTGQTTSPLKEEKPEETVDE